VLVAARLRAKRFAGSVAAWCPGFRRCVVPRVSPLRGYNPGYNGDVLVMV